MIRIIDRDGNTKWILKDEDTEPVELITGLPLVQDLAYFCKQISLQPGDRVRITREKQEEQEK